ncbi:MAG: hypothetical protein AAF665_16445 [Pseudomonadota bacterium]
MTTDGQSDPRGIQRNRPEDVDALASTVISVLRGRQIVSAEGLRQFVLDHMMRAVLAKNHFAPDVLLAELRGYRLTEDAIIDQYVPKTARLLGDDWCNDKISFADVTIGVMRLQALVSEASIEMRLPGRTEFSGLTALVIVPQNEQHFLGASVVAGQLRRLGCEVTMSFDEDFGSLASRLACNVPDFALITCARRETLETVAQTVQTIRSAAGEDIVVAVGGAIILEQDVVIELTGVDIVTSAAEDAAAYCARRSGSRKAL